MDKLTSFLTALLALSLGVERVVEILKGFSSWLRQDPDPATDPQGLRAARRRVVLQILAALVGTGIAYGVGPATLLPILAPIDDSAWTRGMLSALLGLMASGGSALWNHALDIVDSVKKVKERLVTDGSAPRTGGAALAATARGAPLQPVRPPAGAPAIPVGP